MTILFATAIAVTLVPTAAVDLDSRTVYISPEARGAIAAQLVTRLACIDLPARSRTYRTACLTPKEWKSASENADRQNRLDRSEFVAQNFASERFDSDSLSLAPQPTGPR